MFESLKKKLSGLRRKAQEIEPEELTVKETEAVAEEAPQLSRKERKKAAKIEPKPVVGERGKKIKEKALDELLWELELALLEADVALPVVETIKDGVREGLLGRKHDRSLGLDEVVELSLKDAVRKVLSLNEFDFDKWITEHPKPTVIMFVGINGTGKTTAIAKIAKRLQDMGMSVVMAAGDTFRAGAIEQLGVHADRLGVKLIKHQAGGDPAAVAFDAIEHARAKKKDVVLLDTAGRMQTNSNLIDEMKKIKRVAKPDMIMFVGDSLAGNDAVEQARVFNEAVGIDAVMLTKIDADSRGGAALSIAHTIGKPIAFVSNGQEYDQLIKFSVDWMVDRLFD
ncbi:MAG: fused signal recognition particle receptor [Candidatus Methanomethylophilaceae archaeon]|nr:fused signal recognition particle receptor [Candidatus Methanomethylophilaceae archaeon]